MNWITNLFNKLKGLNKAIIRYPLTELFLLAAALMIFASINGEQDYSKQLLTCAVGAFLCAVLQAAYERFFNQVSTRYILMVCGLGVTLGYYLILRSVADHNMEIEIRTAIALFALYFAFVWVPVIRSRISFNESFMATFKAIFQAVFYAVVLYCGCSLIIMAIDTLIITVNYRAYSHIANVIFVLFAPLFFLSLIPLYPGKKDEGVDSEKSIAQEEMINKAVFCPKFLEILISYIIIPLTAVFTFILLLYIMLNIRGEFWTNNLLEPMLISYSITVILIYILSSRLENKFAIWFRLIFPKLLVPIVVFQVISSVISLGDTGVTHTRYLVILYGIFAACAGVVMSLVPVRKNGIIAAMLIGFLTVSILPPIDAFTISRLNQETILKTVLTKNNMIENNEVLPNDLISKEDKQTVISSMEYLAKMGYTSNLAWLPADFSIYEDFYDTFGFYEYEYAENRNQSTNLYSNSSDALDITGYDFFVHTNINSEENNESKICDIENSGNNYILNKENTGDSSDVILTDNDNNEIIRFNMNDIYSKYQGYSMEKSQISSDEATFSNENDQVKITIVVQTFDSNISNDQTYSYVDFYILVQFK
ncbi:MAG: hypothetical protein ACERKZ_04975 [Lachnotalea sp.]